MKKMYPLNDEIGVVEYIEHMGSDLSVINAARASFGKEHTEFDQEKDSRLIKFLARENHIIPFAHPHVTMRFKAPMFVARQLGKHQVGFSWSEESRRYIKTDPEFFIPDSWRKTAENVKQGSSNETFNPDIKCKVFGDTFTATEWVDYLKDVCSDIYKLLTENGICNEQARMILPQNMYTTWTWTGSLLGWSRVYNLRIDPHSQRETQEYANAIGEIMSVLYPISWESLTKKE